MATYASTTEPIVVDDDAFTFRRISWKSIFAGVVLAIVVHILFSLLGVGIGASTIDPLREANPTAGLGTAAGIWFMGTTILSLALGGWLAGRLSGFGRHPDGTIHGILVWAVTTLVTFLLISSAAGALLGGAASIVSRNPALLNPSGQTGMGGVVGSMLDSATRGEGVMPGTGDSAAGAVPGATGDTASRTRVDEAAEQTSQTALWTFFGMLLGAVAAGVGGYLGAARYHHLYRTGTSSTRFDRTADVTGR